MGMLPVYQYELKTKVDIVKGAMNQTNEGAADEKENALISMKAKIDAQKVNIVDLNKLILKNQQDKCKMLRTHTDDTDKIVTMEAAITDKTVAELKVLGTAQIVDTYEPLLKNVIRCEEGVLRAQKVLFDSQNEI